MKILHITRSFKKGGAEVVVNYLASSGTSEFDSYRIFSLCEEKSGDVFSNNRKEKNYYIPYPSETVLAKLSYRLDKIARNILYLVSNFIVVKKINPDIIHIHAIDKFGIPLMEIARFQNIPFVLTLHQMKNFEKPILEKIEKKTRNNNIFYVTFVSEFLKNSSNLKTILQEKQMRVIYNGIDVEYFSKTIDKKNNFREQLNIPNDSIVIGASGRIIKVKRYDILIQAAKILIKKNYRVHFFLAGNGDPELEIHLNELVNSFQINEFFHFLPWQEDIRDYLLNIDVYVITSDSEGLPLGLLEACAMGVPSIATKVGGIPEIFSEVVELIEPGSSELLADKLEYLISLINFSKYSKQGKILAGKHTKDVMIENYVSLYRDLINSKQKRFGKRENEN